ncbi:MAG: cytochrome B6 [Desulfuromonadales bacterium GWD2_61_12]|nr:MAG: cytochrome B6 [Desulfuromonadales bacterium GWC2_61_20]OGR35809.1 MAG: cytochrome B6 [Desulfuromonadales bacterium GWD2_61_12]HAD04570.1 cytochrome B6 [Desulfuromonas sp.]HBT83849.1 cytochrome B6 [Desulfuromonas sp.]
MDTGRQGPSERRLFLLSMLAGVGALLGAIAVWPLYRYLAPQGGGGTTEQVAIPLSDVPLGAARFFDYHGRPAVLVQVQAGEYVALSAVCTHLGCIVKWVGEKRHFLCPCHGGQFAPTGAVLAGPPPQPLASYRVIVQSGKLLVG